MQEEPHKDFAVYSGNGIGAFKIVLEHQTSVFELRQRQDTGQHLVNLWGLTADPSIFKIQNVLGILFGLKRA